jgi:hypothetical protein
MHVDRHRLGAGTVAVDQQISRTRARAAAAMAIAKPTAPTPMMPNFMIIPSRPGMSCGLLMGSKDVLEL